MNPEVPEKTILLLDDDSNTLVVLHAILRDADARVLKCESEPCAVRICEEFRTGIDLLVADVLLEEGSGPAVVRKIRPLQPLMRLLYISGFSLPELSRRGLLSSADISPGAVEFLQKPFSPEQFLESVEHLLVN